jgi:hypothetical protein
MMIMTGEEDPDFDEIQENRDDYFCIEKMGSSEGFRVMSGFAKNIKNRKTREKLFEILERRSPFRNFRAEVESDPKYRTDWFDYRSLQRTLHVREQLSEYFELEVLPEAESAENEKNFNFDGLEFKLDYITPDLFIKKDTRLEFEQIEDLITGELRGTAIRVGTIIAKRNENILELIFQCKLKDGNLKSGKGRADIFFDDNNKKILNMKWNWLDEGSSIKNSFWKKV